MDKLYDPPEFHEPRGFSSSIPPEVIMNIYWFADLHTRMKLMVAINDDHQLYGYYCHLGNVIDSLHRTYMVKHNENINLRASNDRLKKDNRALANTIARRW